jgi:hypothetical protein
LILLSRPAECDVTDLKESDPELNAMGRILEVLSTLEPPMRLRVLQWVSARLEIAPEGPSAFSNMPAGPAGAETGAAGGRREGTVSAVAIKLGADSCRTLMISAAAHLSLYQGKDSFTRAEWIACARDARQWKADYNPQIPTIIIRLLSAGSIFEKAKDVFSVDAAFLAEVGQKLAGR